MQPTTLSSSRSLRLTPITLPRISNPSIATVTQTSRSPGSSGDGEGVTKHSPASLTSTASYGVGRSEWACGTRMTHVPRATLWRGSRRPNRSDGEYPNRDVLTRYLCRNSVTW